MREGGEAVMAGRNPMPTNLKKLRGNPGKRAINAAEPKLAKALPYCPKHLSQEAKDEWHRVSRELYEAGLLTKVDRAALAGYCQAWARWVEAEKKLADEDLVLTTEKGYAYANPLIGVAKQAMADMRAFMGAFGMTPASRGKVTANTETEEDPFDAWARKKLTEEREAEDERS
jgi:P27 family predicted phage terminase small subunit